MLLGGTMFFIVTAILGKTYNGAEEDSSYIIYMSVLCVLSLIFVFKDYILSKRYRLSKLVWLPLIVLLIFLFEYSMFDYSAHSLGRITKCVTLFLVFSVPCFYIGIEMSTRNTLFHIYDYLVICSLLIALGCILSIDNMIMALNNKYLGGASYQAMSYMGAFASGFLFNYLISKNKIESSKLKDNRLVKIASIPLLLGCSISVLMAGGRGGAVLLIASMLYSIIRNRMNGKKRVGTVFTIILIGVLFLFVFSSISQDSVIGERLSAGTERAFSYISAGGIDMSETSNRDEVYGAAVNAIRDQFPMGYGFFRCVGLFSYPHNFFLELLLGGGLFYFIFVIVVLLKDFRKIYLLVKKNHSYSFIVVMLLWPFTYLMFSGTYIYEPLFWFFIGYAGTLNVRNISTYQIERKY